MAYVPPSGNAVNFDFTDVFYVRPSGHSIIFNFGAIPGPPFIDEQLPTGLRQHFTVEDEWFPQARRQFAPPASDTVLAKPMKALFSLDVGDVDYWMMPKRRILVTPPFVAPSKRPVLFTVT